MTASLRKRATSTMPNPSETMRNPYNPANYMLDPFEPTTPIDLSGGRDTGVSTTTNADPYALPEKAPPMKIAEKLLYNMALATFLKEADGLTDAFYGASSYGTPTPDAEAIKNHEAAVAGYDRQQQFSQSMNHLTNDFKNITTPGSPPAPQMAQAPTMPAVPPPPPPAVAQAEPSADGAAASAGGSIGGSMGSSILGGLRSAGAAMSNIPGNVARSLGIGGEQPATYGDSMDLSKPAPSALASERRNAGFKAEHAALATQLGAKPLFGSENSGNAQYSGSPEQFAAAALPEHSEQRRPFDAAAQASQSKAFNQVEQERKGWEFKQPGYGGR